jgi:Ca-activated chloride channel family protein
MRSNSKGRAITRLIWLIGLVVLAIVALAENSRSAIPFGLPNVSKNSPINAQQPISVTSELVAIPVSVTDSKGNFVPGLTKANFQIFEGNQPREIALFEQEDTPVSIGLLVDHSGSMESKLPNVVTAISGFTQASNAQDEMFVVNFGDEARVETFGAKAFTSDPAEIRMAVSLAAEGKTALYDAVFAGLKHLRAARWQKQALVIVSDGGDNASWYKYQQVLEQARQSQVAIYAIGLVDEWGEEENPRILEELCKDTGGIVFFPRVPSAIMSATASVARDLREEYMLGFVPEKGEAADSFHRIQVRVNAPERGKLHVRARPGYSAAGGEGGEAGPPAGAP